MDALRINKIAAALLIAVLLYKGIEILAESAFEVPELETKAYVVAGLEVDEPDVSGAAPEAEVIIDLATLLASASPAQGERVFRGCKACHDVTRGSGHKIGPNLYGVMGASVAQYADYNYSGALADHGGEWSFELMDAWLASPADTVPGNKMTYRGISKPGDRAALIAYLNSNSDNPLEVPAPVSAPVDEPVEPLAEPDTGADVTEDAEEAVEEVAEPAADAVDGSVLDAPEESEAAPEEGVSDESPEAAADGKEEAPAEEEGDD